MGETSACFQMNKLLYEGTILEQQLAYYVLEGEYNEEAGVVTEGLKEIGGWIKDKIEAAIRIISTWIKKLVEFITKTIPQFIKRIADRVLRLLKLRKDPEKVDASKISDGNKEAVKAACDQANKANMAEEAIKKQDDPEEQRPKIADSDENEETKSVESTPKEELKKKIENAKKVSIDKLENIAEKSDSAEEKQEINKTVNNIKAGKTVELSSTNSDMLEGNIIDIKEVNRVMGLIWDYNKDGENGDLRSTLIELNRQDKNKGRENAKEFTKEFYNTFNKDARQSYAKYKEIHDIKVKRIEKSKAKRKYSKEYLDNLTGFDKSNLRRINIELEGAKEYGNLVISILNQIKKSNDVDKKIVYSLIQEINEYMRDVNKQVQDFIDLTALRSKEIAVFLVTAKPVAE